MTKILYVSPVGTSLLQNFFKDTLSQKYIERYRKYNPPNWYRLSPDDPLNKPPDGLICRLNEDFYNDLLEFARRDPRKSSAELNGLLGIREKNHHNPVDVEVLLYNSNTCNSRLCSSVIGEVLKDLGFNIVKVEITSLSSIEYFDDSMIDILDKVVSKIVDARKHNKIIYINATPGFKAETTFFVLASIIAGADSIAYIHEAFKEIIELPIPPLQIDRDLMNEINKLYGNEECLETGLVKKNIGDIVVDRLTRMGVFHSKGNLICIREWIKKLLEIIS
ncbi:MAG: hypothetical protein B6U89_07555 [Desulfurococcales archaeon ex4484_58]|nr:MAG: hypothetical protein B6U89_07555 [Desulfurococcales archaeon ex4484_58]